jgi:selenide,water dikinase
MIVQNLNLTTESNLQAGQIFHKHKASACTDVTGFGLIGHLVEMLKASRVCANVYLSKIPLLPGLQDCIDKGVFSSLHPANARLRHAVRNNDNSNLHPGYPVVFDPQTSGGLLASVPASAAEVCMLELTAAGYAPAIIGEAVTKEGADVFVNVLVG